MHVTLSELSHDTVFVGMGQFHLQVSHHLHVSVVKPPALGFLSTLMRQVVVGRPVYAVDGDDALAVGSLLKGDGIDEQIVIDMHRNLFLMMHPRTGHLLDRSRQAGMPILLDPQRPYRGMLIVKHQVDILHDDTFEVEGKFFFLLFLLLLRFLLRRFLVLLEGINHKLVVSSRVTTLLIQFGMQSLDRNLLYLHLAIQQCQHVYLDSKPFEFEHRAVLQVLHLQVIQSHVIREEADTDTVYRHLRLQLLLQHVGGIS